MLLKVFLAVLPSPGEVFNGERVSVGGKFFDGCINGLLAVLSVSCVLLRVLLVKTGFKNLVFSSTVMVEK